MFIRRRNKQIEVWSPAKVNLSLDIVAKRPDGFHEIQTLMACFDWFDTLRLSSNPGGSINIRIVDATTTATTTATLSAPSHQSAMAESLDDVSRIPTGKGNLVYEALRLLQRETTNQPGADVVLTKRIPAGSGLGGGSGNAAAALIAGNELWNAGCGLGKLRELAAELGSDIPFFLSKSPALCTGRGENVTTVGNLGRLATVVVRPPVGLSTAAVYQRCTISENQVQPSWNEARIPRPHEVGRVLSNGLQPAASQLSDWIRRLEFAFDDCHVIAHQMSGSGTAYFGICRHHKHALSVAGRLKGRNLGTVFCGSIQSGAIVG